MCFHSGARSEERERDAVPPGVRVVGADRRADAVQLTRSSEGRATAREKPRARILRGETDEAFHHAAHVVRTPAVVREPVGDAVVADDSVYAGDDGRCGLSDADHLPRPDALRRALLHRGRDFRHATLRTIESIRTTNKPWAAGLGLRAGAGDGNRTRALSLAITGHNCSELAPTCARARTRRPRVRRAIHRWVTAVPRLFWHASGTEELRAHYTL
jgi:hypothetical protein